MNLKCLIDEFHTWSFFPVLARMEQVRIAAVKLLLAGQVLNKLDFLRFLMLVGISRTTEQYLNQAWEQYVFK